MFKQDRVVLNSCFKIVLSHIWSFSFVPAFEVEIWNRNVVHLR